MSSTKIRTITKLSEEQTEYAKELVEETLAENDLDLDPDEVFSNAERGEEIPQIVARALVGTKLFENITKKPTPVEGGKVTNITLAELEGLTLREKIRRCHAAGMETKDIHTFLGVRPQQIHNTLKALRDKKTDIATCRFCGRPLKDEESILNNAGPICSARH